MKKFSSFNLIIALALCCFQLAQAQGNKEAAKYSREGFEASQSKDWDKAVNAFRKATELDRKQTPNLVAALQQRGVAYMDQQQFPEALADFNEALKLKPNDANIHERRAYIEMKTNDYDKALADYSEAINLKPNEVRYYLLRSYIYETKGDIKNSMADTEKALKLDPGNAEAKSRKARLQARQSAASPPVSSPKPAPPASKSP